MAFWNERRLIQHLGIFVIDCLAGLAETFPDVKKLLNQAEFDKCNAACVGLDGRAIRKMVANALERRKETAMTPNSLSSDDLIEAANDARKVRAVGKGG